MRAVDVPRVSRRMCDSACNAVLTIDCARRSVPKGVDELTPGTKAVREPVAIIEAPRCDHPENQPTALAEQFLIHPGISVADDVRDMGEIEFDRAPATRLEVDEQQPLRGAQHVARVWLAVQELLGGAAFADRGGPAS